MACSYEGNAFCASLPPDVRERLCAGCRVRSYDARSIHDLDYWRRGPALLVNGFAAFGSTADSQGKIFSSREWVCQGQFISWGPSVQQASDPSCVLDCFELYCLTDCDIALWEQDVFRDLYESDIRFLKCVIPALIAGWGNAEAMLSCETAYDKLCYYLDFCRRAGFRYATHEQIAIACNLSRQTVTRLMSEIIRNESELFEVIE
ncbi:MAG: Crp/Fnr family transcriptional regulator [Adlercreutzia sp.]|nr:Crp/Fnr family transcriptional regulator [Adlercreutzia sp.]